MHEIIVIDISETSPKGLGQMKFKTHPLRGEWVEIEENGIASMFEVVMVAHSTSGAGSDLYVRRINVTSTAVKSLCN